jgi:hypothetical protein
MNFVILTEGGHNIGFGHITRCIAIYEELLSRKIYPSVFINGDNTFSHLVNDIDYLLVDWYDIDFLKNDLPKLIKKPMDDLDLTYQKLREAGRKKAYKPKSLR